MKRLLFAAILIFASIAAFSQDDEYQKFLEQRKKQMQEKSEANKQKISDMSQEYKDYVDRMNAEFADFVAKQWELFDEFKKQQLSYSQPKIEEAPVAVNTVEEQDVVTEESKEIKYVEEAELPAVTEAVKVAYEGKDNDNYELKTRLDKNGAVDLPVKEYVEEKPAPITYGTEIKLNFYGRQVPLHVSQKLKAKSNGIDEKNVANYFTNIAKNREETKALWDELTGVVDEFGLNEWGYFCLLRSLSEKLFTNIDDRVLFCFYMLRNEGNFKTRVARGKNSDKLTLLIALDNSKEVYSYTFFQFKDDESGTKKVKYYTVYGGGKANEAVYSYDFCKQDADKREMKLDFTKNLNMGACDVTRTVHLTKKRSVTLPYNKAHMAYLNDVPMTVFPIYFVNPIAIEAQQVLQDNFSEMRDQYTPTQFIQMLLHFVQTGFEYKTDDDQFGYEKYFYPEEVIGYPYCDCEDRSAMFAWLVQKYTNAKVIGLQYEGHVATAVWFGDDANVKGDGFMYGGKKYYVCDPTYINASIGMTMPQFKGKTPKIIKLRK
ncbi:MAG: hypothetical protein J6W12_02390 [Bacteroidales bacterium]|nr:hypothetical protein [Bacteroidales bacterium]